MKRTVWAIPIRPHKDDYLNPPIYWILEDYNSGFLVDPPRSFKTKKEAEAYGKECGYSVILWSEGT